MKLIMYIKKEGIKMIYIVFGESYGEKTVLGVFDTKEKALNYLFEAEEIFYSRYSVCYEEHKLNEGIDKV